MLWRVRADTTSQVGYAGDAAGSLRSLLGAATMLGIDAGRGGNETRMTNDYRGIGSVANCNFSRSWLRGSPALFVITVADVPEGHEFLLDYGELYWKHALRLSGSQETGDSKEVTTSTEGGVTAEDLLAVERDLLEMLSQAEEE